MSDAVMLQPTSEERMNIFDKAVIQAKRACKREQRAVFLHCTYKGIVLKYEHLGVIAQPTYMVIGSKIVDVTINIDTPTYARCSRYAEIYK